MTPVFSRKQKLGKPRKLLPKLLTSPRGTWVDMACGDGVFAEVLLEIGKPEIRVLGLDINRSALLRFRDQLKTKYVEVLTLQADLESPLPFSGADGIIFANGLHFFPERQQVRVLRNIASSLKHDGQIIIVEYNSERSTAAVPYPISEKNITRLLIAAGFHPPHKDSRASSSYLGEIYAVLTTKAAL
ncbi:MAG: class I SAM-dependent methyltransferase [Anaerolineales bacterium]